MSCTLLRSALRSLSAALIVAALPALAIAQTNGTYTSAVSGNWSVSGNWALTGADPYPTNGGVASFAGGVFTVGSNGFITANTTVTVDAGVTLPLQLSGINFNNVANAFAYTIAPATTQAITFVDPVGSPGAGATLSITSSSNLGTNTISTPVTLNTNLNVTSGTSILPVTQVSGTITGGSGVNINISSAYDEAGYFILGPSSGASASSFTGGVTLTSGSLQIESTSTGSPGAVTAGPLGTGTLTVNGGQLLNGGVTINNSITANATLVVSGGGSGDTMASVISGAGGLTYRARGGTLALTNTDTYMGATLVTNQTIPITNSQPAVGTISLSLNGSALNSTSFTAQGGGTILLDNSGQASSGNRIASTAGVTVQNGKFQINGANTAGSASFTQRAGALTSNGGFGTVVVNPTAAGDEGVVMNFASLSRAGGNGTFLFNGGGNLGSSAAGLGVAQITFTTPPTLVGSGSPGTPTVGIIPYAIGSIAAAGTGTDLVTYGTFGVRVLIGAEYAASNSTLTAGQNVKLTAAGATITSNSPIAVQSLVISPVSGNDTLSGTGTLTVTSGTILSTSSGNNVINNPLNFGAAEGVVFTTSSLANNIVINSVISGTGGLTQGGPGVLNMALGGAGPSTLNVFGNTYTGVTTLTSLNVINDARVYGPDTSTIQAWAAASGNNSGITNTTGGLALYLNRSININDGFFSINANGTRTATLMTGTLSGAGSLYMANGTGGGTTFLSGTNTITGEIRVNNGNLAVASDANLGSAAAVDINGGVAAATPAAGLRLFGNLTTSKQFNITGSSTLDTGSFTAQLNGPLSEFGTDYIAKFGTGTLQFTNAQNGLLGMIVDNGTVKLTGAGNLLNATGGAIAINSGSLVLDSTTGGTTPKLSSGQNVQFGVTTAATSIIANGGGGILELDAGGNAGVTQQLTALTIPLAASATTAPSVASFILNSGGGSGSVTLQATNLIYSASGGINTANTMMFVAGDGLGTTSKLLISNFQVNGVGSGATNALIGGAYAGNVGTPTLGIIRGGYGDITATGTGSGLLTYDGSTGGGFRLLAPSEYASYPSAVTASNVLVNASTNTNTASDSINSLFITGGNTLTTTGTLTIVSGTILSTGGSNVINGTGINGGGGTLQGQNSGAISGFNFAVPTNLLVNTVLAGGAGELVKMGPGTLTIDPLSAAGTTTTTGVSFTGGVDIAGGTLAVTDTTATLAVLSTGPFYLSNGAKLSFAGQGVLAASARNINLYGAGGTLDLPGTFLQTNTTTVIAGSGALTLTSGTLVVGANSTEANTYQGGTNLNGGTLLINNTSASGLGLGVLNLNGGQLGVRSASRTISANETAIFANTSFVNKFTVVGPAPGGNLSADTSNGSSLTFSAPVRLENSVTLTNNMLASGVANGGQVIFSGSIYDNPFIAPSQLTLASGGNDSGFVFSFSNSYRGGTVLSSGTLAVTNTFASGTGSGIVTVNGGTLKGTGYILPTQGSEAANTVSINSGGILSPGNALGTLTVGSPVTPGTTTATVNENSAAIFNFLYSTGHVVGAALDTGGSETPGGATGNNFLKVYGTLDINSLADFQISSVTLTDFPTTSTYSFQLAAATTIGGAYEIDSVNDPSQFLGAGAASLEAAGFILQVDNNGANPNNEYFNLIPVPEPGTMLLLGAAGVGGLGWYRRRRQAKNAAAV